MNQFTSEGTMKNRVWIGMIPCVVGFFIGSGQALAENNSNEILNEVPIWPIPLEMTAEEYSDANRRIGVGMLLMSVPLPGTMHFYAGEERRGWMHAGAAILGGAAIVLGAATTTEKDSWASSDYEVVDIVGASGNVKRYEKIPVAEEAGTPDYKLRELDHEISGIGPLFMVLGAGLIAGSIIHDWIGGIKTIVRKRDAVRYKYGKAAGYELGLAPRVDLDSGIIGAEISLRF